MKKVSLWLSCLSSVSSLLLRISNKHSSLTFITEENKFFLYTDANEKSTNIISLDVNYLVSKTLFVHLGDHRPIALDFDPLEDRVYWTDVRQGRIMSAFRNASSAKTLYFCNVLNPDGLDIDHVGRNIYWTDTGTDRIELGRLDGTKRKVLFKDALDEPRAIILDERNGLVIESSFAMYVQYVQELPFFFHPFYPNFDSLSPFF